MQRFIMALFVELVTPHFILESWLWSIAGKKAQRGAFDRLFTLIRLARFMQLYE
jgi:hypothetical protein